MTTRTQTSLSVSRVVKADPATAFAAWTEPEQIKRWSSPEGATVEESIVDLTVGGAYRLRMLGQEGETYTAFGTYREIDPPHRIVYTWDWEEETHQMGETLVTVEFTAVAGGTEVTVTHEQLPGQEAKDGHEAGWVSCLDRYEQLLA